MPDSPDDLVAQQGHALEPTAAAEAQAQAAAGRVHAQREKCQAELASLHRTPAIPGEQGRRARREADLEATLVDLGKQLAEARVVWAEKADDHNLARVPINRRLKPRLDTGTENSRARAYDSILAAIQTCAEYQRWLEAGEKMKFNTYAGRGQPVMSGIVKMRDLILPLVAPPAPPPPRADAVALRIVRPWRGISPPPRLRKEVDRVLSHIDDMRCQGLLPGEVAGFTPEMAKLLVAIGWAEVWTPAEAEPERDVDPEGWGAWHHRNVSAEAWREAHPDAAPVPS